MLFRTLSVAPGCNKVSENEKTSGNRYKSRIIQVRDLMRASEQSKGRRSTRPLPAFTRDGYCGSALEIVEIQSVIVLKIIIQSEGG